MKKLLTSLVCLLAVCSGMCQSRIKTHVPLDSIVLSDPCILPDRATMTYYMTGTGGKLWKSKDLRYWDGPYTVAETDPESWMGPKPMIWAAELHQYKGKYYYFATFTNQAVSVGRYKGNNLERRACHVLVSDKAEGPYRPMKVDRHGRTALHGLLPRMAAKLGRHYRKNRIETQPKRQHRRRKTIVQGQRIALEPGSHRRRHASQPCDGRPLFVPHPDRTLGYDMDQLDL